MPKEPLSLMFGAIHETGHALYEQGIPGAFSRISLGNAALGRTAVIDLPERTAGFNQAVRGRR